MKFAYIVVVTCLVLVIFYYSLFKNHIPLIDTYFLKADTAKNENDLANEVFDKEVYVNKNAYCIDEKGDKMRIYDILNVKNIVVFYYNTNHCSTCTDRELTNIFKFFDFSDIIIISSDPYCFRFKRINKIDAPMYFIGSDELFDDYFTNGICVFMTNNLPLCTHFYVIQYDADEIQTSHYYRKLSKLHKQSKFKFQNSY